MEKLEDVEIFCQFLTCSYYNSTDQHRHYMELKLKGFEQIGKNKGGWQEYEYLIVAQYVRKIKNYELEYQSKYCSLCGQKLEWD